jgi:hypothetical protein
MYGCCTCSCDVCIFLPIARNRVGKTKKFCRMEFMCLQAKRGCILYVLCRTQRIYTRFLWLVAAAYSTSDGCYGFFLVIHALYIFFRENSSFISLFLLLVDIIDCQNNGQIYLKDNKSFICHGLIIMGTWISRTIFTKKG